MSDPTPNTPQSYEVDKFTGLQFPYEVLKAIGVSLGLTLFWTLEKARDGIFHALDQMNLKPRIRRASAFPPGRPPRKRRRAAIEP
jgi:membrane-bound lytic murein transglycosylase MltF